MNTNKIRDFRDQMRQLQRSLGGLAKSDAVCCGITVAQCHILMEIGKGVSLSLKELAAKLALDTSTVSRTLDLMARQNLVARQTSHSDRRYLNLTLTTKGAELYHSINSTYDHYYLAVFRGIPPEKHEQVMESIAYLNNSIKSTGIKECCPEEIC